MLLEAVVSLLPPQTLVSSFTSDPVFTFSLTLFLPQATGQNLAVFGMRGDQWEIEFIFFAQPVNGVERNGKMEVDGYFLYPKLEYIFSNKNTYK